MLARMLMVIAALTLSGCGGEGEERALDEPLTYVRGGSSQQPEALDALMQERSRLAEKYGP